MNKDSINNRQSPSNSNDDTDTLEAQALNADSPSPVGSPASASGQAPTPEVAPTTKDTAPLISYDDFLKVQLRIAQISAAERIEKSEKLVRLQVEVGEEKRQLVAGIAKHYTPEQLVGRKIVIVANLKPAKLMGEKSEGMLLAASDDQGNLALLDVDPIIPSGTLVR